jgi:pimeloyl-ACP methyl ester carboxylesterase
MAVGCGGGTTPPATTTVAGAGADGSDPELLTASCPELKGFRCSSLDVPVHRNGRTDAKLALRVAVQRVEEAPRGVLVALAGGPGQPGLPFAARIRKRLGAGLRGYRLVVLDQRGTGDGAIRCPALQSAVGASDVTRPPAGAVRACARRLGDRRDAYSTAATVADLEDLRRALRAPRLTLLGVSYGTFVAERYALAHPRRTARLVLDSVVPQEGAELLYRPALRATGRVLRDVCRRQRCAGDPSGDVAALIRARPRLAVPLFDALVAYSIGAPDFPGVPQALHAARRGDRAALDRILAVTGNHEVPVKDFSSGLHAAALCADSPAPWGGPAAPMTGRRAALAQVVARMDPAETAPFPPVVAAEQGLVPTCLHWAAMRAPRPPAGGRITAPALLLNGTRDLSTPLEWARAQARRMTAAKLVVLPGAGHSTLGRDERARAATRRFLQAG